MSNATLQTPFSSSTPVIHPFDQFVYRNGHWDAFPFYTALETPVQGESITANWSNVAHAIWHEAMRFDVLTDAHKENAARPEPLASWEAALMAPVEGAPFDQDTEAALRQAEMLGATADQRNKLRAIVTARITAERELATAREALARAEAPITDAQDRRIWPVLGQAATEADRQGYCSTYEQIAGAVGMPDRDTLKDLGFAQGKAVPGRVEVYLHYSVWVEVDDIEDFDLSQSEVDEAARRYIQNDLNSNDWEMTGETDAD
jgi:hypothetical protein